MFLVARRDPNAPYWNQNISDLPWMLQHDLNLAGCVCEHVCRVGRGAITNVRMWAQLQGLARAMRASPQRSILTAVPLHFALVGVIVVNIHCVDWALFVAVPLCVVFCRYSLRSHRTSLFRVSQDSNDVELLYDIPGCGDTAFPSIVRVSEHTYIIVNYSNPFELCPDWPWIEGQISSSGSQLYFLLLQFEPSS